MKKLMLAVSVSAVLIGCGGGGGGSDSPTPTANPFVSVYSDYTDDRYLGSVPTYSGEQGTQVLLDVYSYDVFGANERYLDGSNWIAFDVMGYAQDGNYGLVSLSYEGTLPKDKICVNMRHLVQFYLRAGYSVTSNKWVGIDFVDNLTEAKVYALNDLGEPELLRVTQQRADDLTELLNLSLSLVDKEQACK